ncbi:hypothetical protein J1N35_005814 [Gossypium stocksii]|uniref:Zinc knuckle CX2CX4HX4C domain-containing protein n=1 Tax=Gossypium stocksii TaxID=47602 RepID=A0A9D3WDM2_9ROSI|nr:hypothetical protein J1N35_005814 [Gossypium stocksii]
MKPYRSIKNQACPSPFWLKISPCSPKFDKKDLLHAIGSTFGGIIWSKIKVEFCRLWVQLDVQKPLRQHIFILVGGNARVWISFKYENLATFCFWLWENGTWGTRMRFDPIGGKGGSERRFLVFSCVEG